VAINLQQRTAQYGHRRHQARTELKWPREFYRGAPLKTSGLPLDVAEKTANLVGIWSASVSRAAFVEVDRMLELGPSIADTLSKASPMRLRRNAMRFPDPLTDRD